MGDVRFTRAYTRVKQAGDRAAVIRSLTDEEVVAALAGASRERDPLLANVLATEAQNRASRSQRVLSSLGDAIITTSWPSRRILAVNPAAERMFGWSEEELRDSSAERLHRDRAQFEELGALAEATFASEETLETELFMKRRSGEVFPAEVTVSLIRDVEGEPVALVTILRDATQRQRAEAALRESTERFRAATEHAAIGMALVGLDGRFLEANAAYARITGYSKEELRARTFQSITHPDDVDADVAQAQALAAGRVPSYDMEKRYIHKDGHPVWVFLTGSVVRDPSGLPLYFIAQVQDITARKAAERRLAAQNAITRVLAEARSTDEVAVRGLRVLCETLGWDLAELWRVDASGEHLARTHVHASTQEGHTFLSVASDRTFTRGEGLPGRVWREERTASVADASSDPRFARRAAAAKAGLRAGSGFPVIVGDRTLGVVTLLAREMRAFDEQDRDSLDGIGRQLGLFFERAVIEERMSEIVEAAPDATVIVDAEGRIVLFNGRAERLLGYRREDVLGRRVEMLIPERLRARHVKHRADYAQAPRARPAGTGLDLVALRKDGVEIPVEISLAPVGPTDGQLTIASMRPVMELRRPPTAQPIPEVVSRLRAATIVAALVTISAGVTALLGWTLNAVWLTALVQSAPSMLPETALAVILAGTALLLLGGTPDRSAERVRRGTARVAAVAVVLLGALLLADFVFERRLPLGGYFARGEPEFLAAITGGAVLQTAIGTILGGIALFFADRGGRSVLVTQTSALGLATLAVIALAGYAFDASLLYRSPGDPPTVGMALLTAVAFLALSLGLLLVRPTAGIARTLTSDSTGGALARRIAPISLGLPLVVGAAILALARVVGLGVGPTVAIFAVAMVHIAGLLIGIASLSLDRQDRARRRAETLFRGILLSAPDATLITDEAGTIRYVSHEAERMFGYDRGEMVGMRIESLVPRRLRDAHVKHRATFTSAPRTRPMGQGMDLLAVRKDGTEFPVEISLSPTRTEEGLLITAAVRDVTDRQRTQAEMARLAAIVRDTDDAVIGSSLDGTITTWNRGAERLFGYKAEEAIGGHLVRLSPEDDPQPLLDRIAVGETIKPLEARRVTKDGRALTVQLTFSPVRDASGTVIGAATIARDMTARKESERELRKLAAIVEQTDDLVLVTDMRGRIVYVNRAFESVTGYTMSEVKGLTPRILKSGAQDPEIYERLWRAILQGRTYRAEFVNRRKDGSLYTEDKTITPILNAEGEIESFVSTGKDVTERKEAEARIAHLDRLHTMLAEANEAIFRASDRKGLVRDVCRAVVEGGRLRMAWIGFVDPTTQRVEPAGSAGVTDGYIDVIRRALHVTPADTEFGRGPTGTAIREEAPIVCNDVETDPRMAPWREEALRRGYRSSGAFPLTVESRVVGTLSVYAAEKNYFGPDEIRVLSDLGSDIGLALESMERRDSRDAAEARLMEANQLLERRVEERTRQLMRANNELEAFTYRVSHDLRAPLRGLSFFLDTLKAEQEERLDTEGKELIERALRERGRMTRLVDDLLRLSRSQTADLRRAPVDVEAIATEIIGQLREREPSRRVETVVEPGLTVEADPDLLRIVLENLLSNAWKFTSKAVPLARIEVGALPRTHPGAVTIFVRDNGVGFSPEQADQLFQLFHRLPSAATFEGTGIGLATVARIVQRHGGHAWAEGSPGEGATFYFTMGPTVTTPKERQALTR